MDNIFLKDIVESYEIDRNLKNIKDKAFNYLVNTRKYIKETQVEIYEDIQYNSSKLTQQRLFYSLLDEVMLTEDLGLVSGGALFLASTYILNKLFSSTDQKLQNFFTSLQKIHLDIRKSLKDSSVNKSSENYADRYQLVEKILDSRYSNCTKMCGVKDLENASKNDIANYMRVLFSPGEEHPTLMPRHAQEANCLISCYLDYITSAIAELNLLYNQCMQKTGEISKDPGITKVIVPLGTKCDQLRKDVDDLKSEFNKFLKYLYKNNPRLYSLWTNLLITKLDDAQNNKKVTNYAPHITDMNNPTKLSLGL